MQSKLLVSGKFCSDDIVVGFSGCGARKIDDVLEGEIDKAWRKYSENKLRKGGLIWDSVTYRLNDMVCDGDTLKIELGEINFSKRIGVRSVLDKVKKLDKSYYPLGIFVTGIIRTNDSGYVLGCLSGKTVDDSKLGLIGGVLSADELVVNKSSDVFTALTNEIKEEINIDKKYIENMYLRAIIQTEKLQICFLFDVTLNLNKEQVRNKFIANEELSDIKICTKTQLRKILKSAGGYKEVIAEVV